MNDPQILDELDERGRTAGRDLLHRADSRTRPGFDTDLAAALPASAPDPRHHARRPLLAHVAVAAAVAAQVGAAFVEYVVVLLLVSVISAIAVTTISSSSLA